jgi:predicted ATPase
MIKKRKDKKLIIRVEGKSDAIIQQEDADACLKKLTEEKDITSIIVWKNNDHFINRIRRRIAEDKTDTLKNNVEIHIVDKDKNETILTIDKYGIMSDWPDDFLNESADEAEAILKAGMKKRGVEF